MTDLVLSPAILGRSHALRTRVAGAVITLLAVLLVFAVAPANLRNLPAVGALARALEPGVAAADSYYNDEACDNNTVNWSLTEDGSNVIFDNQPCHTPIESQGWGIYDNLSWNGAGSGANGAQNYFSFYAPGGPTGQTTLSQFNSGPFVAAAEYGFGAGLMGDIGDGHGMLADNDPRNLAKGQSVPDNTVGQMADCWGYGNADNPGRQRRSLQHKRRLPVQRLIPSPTTSRGSTTSASASVPNRATVSTPPTAATARQGTL